MNLHHLELFYYVARHGGIMPAVRNIPYGIQQPAVSGQIAQLERELGHSLFQRRPFKLLPAGEKLFRYIRPFFEHLPEIQSRIRGQEICPLRVAAPTLVLKSHLPQILSSIRTQFPGLRLQLNESPQDTIENELAQAGIDIGISLLEKEVAVGLESHVLLKFPLVLLCPARFKEIHRNVRSLLKSKRASMGLISLPERDGLTRHFQGWMAAQGLEWPVSIEVSSLELIETYVRHDFGIGLGIRIPGRPDPADLHVLPLEGLDPVLFGVLWRKPLTPVAQAFLEEVKDRAKKIEKQAV